MEASYDFLLSVLKGILKYEYGSETEAKNLINRPAQKIVKPNTSSVNSRPAG